MTSLREADMRLLKAGGDVCRALGVYAESPEAAVVNELVRAVRHQAAERVRGHGSHDEPGFGRWNCDFQGCQELADLIEPVASCACGNPDGPHIPGADSMVCTPDREGCP